MDRKQRKLPDTMEASQKSVSRHSNPEHPKQVQTHHPEHELVYIPLKSTRRKKRHRAVKDAAAISRTESQLEKAMKAQWRSDRRIRRSARLSAVSHLPPESLNGDSIISGVNNMKLIEKDPLERNPNTDYGAQEQQGMSSSATNMTVSGPLSSAPNLNPNTTLISKRAAKRERRRRRQRFFGATGMDSLSSLADAIGDIQRDIMRADKKERRRQRNELKRLEKYGTTGRKKGMWSQHGDIDGNANPEGSTHPSGNTNPLGTAQLNGNTNSMESTCPSGNAYPNGSTHPDTTTILAGSTNPDAITHENGSANPDGDERIIVSGSYSSLNPDTHSRPFISPHTTKRTRAHRRRRNRQTQIQPQTDEKAQGIANSDIDIIFESEDIE